MALKDIILKLTGLSGSRQYLVDNIASPDLVAAMLVIFAKSDGGISPEENLRMVQLLREKYGLQPGEALELVTRVAAAGTPADDAEKLFTSVNEEFSDADKEELLLMALSVIAADREKDAREMELLATLVDKLQVSDTTMEPVYTRYFATRKSRAAGQAKE